MNKPRIFLGSSGKQAKLLQAITAGSKTSPTSSPNRVSITPIDRCSEAAK